LEGDTSDGSIALEYLLEKSFNRVGRRPEKEELHRRWQEHGGGGWKPERKQFPKTFAAIRSNSTPKPSPKGVQAQIC
jgi:hypothetical protein